jgi:hypothetical protein
MTHDVVRRKWGPARLLKALTSLLPVSVLGGTVAAPGAAGAATSPPSQSPTSEQPTGPGWVYFPAPAPGSLANPTTFIVDGDGPPSGTNGCPVSGSLFANAGESLDQDEIAMNTQTCSVEYEEGSPTSSSQAASPQADVPSASSKVHVSATKDAVVSPSSVRPETVDYWGGYYDQQWEDPAHIQVNAQELWLYWTAQNGNVTGVESSSAKWSWLRDGWAKRWGSLATPGYNSASATGGANSAFDNSLFCKIITGGLGSETYTYFGWISSTNSTTLDKLYGYPGGSINATWNDYTNGGCSGLLHHNTAESP